MTQSTHYAGILGGGQLAWMLSESAEKYGIKTRVWDSSVHATGFLNAWECHSSSWDSYKSVPAFAKGLDFCTFEWESVPLELIKTIEEQGLAVVPSRVSLEAASSRIRERELFAKLGFATSPMMFVKSQDDLRESVWRAFCSNRDFDHIFLKSDSGGYDGKGQRLVHIDTPLNEVKDFFKDSNYRGIVEAKIDLHHEVSIIGARTIEGKMTILGFFKNKHQNGILRVSRLMYADEINERSHLISMMKSLLIHTKHVGVAALELFVDKSGKTFANEWAPRVHNSGHLTQEALALSQFDYHWRALLNLELPEPVALQNVIMINVLGEDLKKYNKEDLFKLQNPFEFFKEHLTPSEFSRVKSAKAYDYQKKDLREGRKMGHINVILNDQR